MFLVSHSAGANPKNEEHGTWNEEHGTTMPTGLLGRKVGMTQVFDEGGRVVPVTVIQAGPCWVTQVKTAEEDGYNAVQLGFEESRKLSGAERGHLVKAGTPMLRHLREWRV